MNKLLKYWETHVGYPIDSSINNKSTTTSQQQQRRTNNQLKDPIRRLTTTISRSVQIQTDSDGKSFEEKGVITDNNNHFDLKQQIFHHHHQQQQSKSSSALNHGENDNFKPNLPIIEKPMIAKTINTFHVCSDNKTDNILIDLDPLSPLSSQQQQQPQPRQSYRSPEPIVEMYSDSDDDDDVVEDDDDNEDDTYFDNFEKDIFNEISRRALIRNKIITRSRSAQQLLPTRIEDTTNLMKNSGTQTKNLKRDNNNVRISETPSTMGATTATTTNQKRMQSTSKIIIERQTQNNQKEKREVIIKTDIDHDGKVHRTTEIRNCKQKNMLPMIDMIKIENECFPPTTLPSSLMMMTNDGRNNDNIQDEHEQQERRRQQQKKKNVSNEKLNDIFPRTQSAFDLMTDHNNNNENMILGKTDNDYLSNKAFSSLDIRSLTKSPVISEGYHSERLDSSTQIHHHNHKRQHTPESDRQQQQQYIIEPPESYCQTPEYSPNNMNNTWIMNNETLIENSGKEMNITTKSSTIRKPTIEECKFLFVFVEIFKCFFLSMKKQIAKSKFQTQIRKSPINMNYIDDDDSPKQQQQQSRSRSAKTTAQTYVPTAAAATTTTTYRNPNDNLNECKFSFVCNNNGTNIVFRFVLFFFCGEKYIESLIFFLFIFTQS